MREYIYVYVYRRGKTETRCHAAKDDAQSVLLNSLSHTNHSLTHSLYPVAVRSGKVTQTYKESKYVNFKLTRPEYWSNKAPRTV